MPVAISEVLVARAEGAFANDDQAAILAGAVRDGFVYLGEPLTVGFRRIRQPATALSIILILDDGAVIHGDAVTVQYAGAAGREPPIAVDRDAAATEAQVRRALLRCDVSSFRAASEVSDCLRLSAAVKYGLSQALLSAAAHATHRTIAELVADEYALGTPLREVALFAQCGEDRRGAVDRMILRAVDELPHGLINHAPTLVGPGGERLLEYVRWVRDRVLALREGDGYTPVLHFDCYGTLGEVFSSPAECARYIARLGEVAAPLRLRVEQPIDGGSRDAQISQMAALRRRLRDVGSSVELVADEWCNTLSDVESFIRGDAADMIQVKTPDLGTVDQTIKALLACKRAGVGAYCGGSCTDTEDASRVFVGVAMGTHADLLLARPGMGVDEAIMVTRNEMRRTAALVGFRTNAADASTRDRSV